MGHIGLVAALGRVTEDMEKTSGQEVEEAVCCILIVLEDMVKMRRIEVEQELVEMETEVVLEILGGEASVVQLVD